MSDFEVLTPETVEQLRDAGPKDLVWLLADSHEALRVEVARLREDFRKYWTHCGEPEWYGDEERTWLRAALAGPSGGEDEYVDDDRGPNSNYQMFSREGNDACEALVQKIVAEGEAGKINRLTLHAAVRAGIKEISKKYLEVQDTEPDGEIPYQINERLCKPMRWVEYGRWTD